MLTRWTEINREFPYFEELRRRMDRVFDELDPPARAEAHPGLFDAPYRMAALPRVSLFDVGQNLVVKAEVPGLSDKDVRITINQDVLSIEGERKADAPEGFRVHRRERSPASFSRSFALPTRVDAEQSVAVVKDGILTVTLRKAADAQPRQIAVRAE